jgi:hypothetical protein
MEQPEQAEGAQQSHNSRPGERQHADRPAVVVDNSDEVVHKQDLVQLAHFLVGNSHDPRRHLVQVVNRKRHFGHRPFACNKCIRRRTPTHCQ